MGDEIKECLVIKDDIVDIIIIKNDDCSMRDAMHHAIYRLQNEV